VQSNSLRCIWDMASTRNSTRTAAEKWSQGKLTFRDVLL
jgi:hypothetical protein